jgi:hypothetical protein
MATKATRFIHEAADFVRNSGFTVTIDSPFSWVSIDGPDDENVFMQGEEAETFIDEVRTLCKRYPSLTEDTAALALAKPYVECCFN